MPGGSGVIWERKVPTEVSQEYLDTHRVALCNRPWVFLVEGDENAPTVDHGEDGIPDLGWHKADMIDWLKSHGLSPKGYTTKTKLLEMVEGVLNPEPVAEPEVPAEEPVELKAPEESE